MSSSMPRHLVLVVLTSTLTGSLVAAGCGGGGRQKLTVVEGTVSLNGVPVQLGVVRFVALNHDPSQYHVAPKLAVIKDGKYRVDAGLPDGQYRIEVEAQRNTGEQVSTGLPGEKKIDRIVRISPDAFAGNQSPLRFDTTRDKSPVAIQIPSQ